MIISGIQKTSLIDYPRKICTVLFTRGCNFSCGFCHNPELVIPKQFIPKISTNEILIFLKKRTKKIDAVTITGGEPTLHKDLPNFIQKIKNMGYLVKLDTNGSNPQMLQKIVNKKIVDYIAMDIKNSPRKYKKTTNSRIDFKNIKQSVEIIKASNISYEFRTTVIPTLHDKKSFEDISKWLKGSRLLILQQFRPGKHIDLGFANINPYTQKELKEFKNILAPYINKIKIR